MYYSHCYNFDYFDSLIDLYYIESCFKCSMRDFKVLKNNFKFPMNNSNKVILDLRITRFDL